MSCIIKYRNWYAIVEIYNAITFIVKFLIAKKTFEEILNHSSKSNIENTNTDIFWKGMAVLTRGILLQNYIFQV